MKLIGIVGSTAEVSTNRKLLTFIKKQFTELFYFGTGRNQRFAIIQSR